MDVCTSVTICAHTHLFMHSQVIEDMTQTDLVNLRRTIYLTIMSSMDFEEAGHKLLKMGIPQGQEIELVTMLIECCSQVGTRRKPECEGMLGVAFSSGRSRPAPFICTCVHVPQAIGSAHISHMQDHDLLHVFPVFFPCRAHKLPCRYTHAGANVQALFRAARTAILLRESRVCRELFRLLPAAGWQQGCGQGSATH